MKTKDDHFDPMDDLPDDFVMPEGFSQRLSRGSFSTRNGPYFATKDGRTGFHVLGRHCNSMGFMHGGMMAAVADVATAHRTFFETGKTGVTIKLSVEYTHIVRVGSWIEGRIKVDGITDNIVFLSGHMQDERERIVAKVSASFNLVNR